MLEAAFETALWWFGLGALAMVLLSLGAVLVVAAFDDAEIPVILFGLILLVFGGSLTWMLLVAAHAV